MNKPDNAARDSCASHYYGLIPYKPPDQFIAIEAATFDHGTHAERLAVNKAVCIRSHGVPASVIQSGDTNYSSAKYDADRFRKSRARLHCFATPSLAAKE